METKSQSLVTCEAHNLFFKNEHFQRPIISVIFYHSHSDPAQESIILIIGSFLEKYYI